jgi:hypothetical protein
VLQRFATWAFAYITTDAQTCIFSTIIARYRNDLIAMTPAAYEESLLPNVPNCGEQPLSVKDCCEI